jgi:hypothetical protein
MHQPRCHRCRKQAVCFLRANIDRSHRQLAPSAVRGWKVREESPSPLQWHRVVEEDQALAAGFIWNRLLLIQLFNARSKINGRRCQWGPLTLALILSDISQSYKDSGNTRPT